MVTNINLSTLNGTSGFSLLGAELNDMFGYAVSSAGDVNGDGYDDLIIGAFGANASYVVLGRASGFNATLNVSSLDGSNGFVLKPGALGYHFGASVSSAGDINGDGFADLIVGDEASNHNGLANSGSSFVVFGKASGFGAQLSTDNLNGSNGFQMTGIAADDHLGSSVSGAGDVNGDGFDDLIVGASGAGTDDVGASYVVFGKASGFSANFDLSALNGSNGFRLNGAIGEINAGFLVSNAGDVNGDRYDDLIVASNPSEPANNSSFVVFGKASGFSATLDLSNLDGSNGFRLDEGVTGNFTSISNAGDVNGDGFGDLIVGATGVSANGAGGSYVVFGKAAGFGAALDVSNLDGSNGFRLNGFAENDRPTVSNAGDVNGDGFGDLIVGGFNYSGGTNNAGFVVYGKASGFSAALNLSSIDGSNGFRLDGGDANPVPMVSSAGDVNGDGFDDLVIGQPAYGAAGDNSHVVFGGNFSDAVTHLGTSAADTLTGTSKADRIVAGGGNDVIASRGGADVFYGGAGDDIIRASNLNFQLIDGGSGYDTLGLAGSNLHLNLSNVKGRLTDIEKINMYGNGDNTVSLTAFDVLNISSTSNTLKVSGNAGDRVFGLSNGWTDGGIKGAYHVYTQDAAVLLVGVNVTTDFA